MPDVVQSRLARGAGPRRVQPPLHQLRFGYAEAATILPVDVIEARALLAVDLVKLATQVRILDEQLVEPTDRAASRCIDLASRLLEFI